MAQAQVETDPGSILVAAAVGVGPCTDGDADCWTRRVAVLAHHLSPLYRSLAAAACFREIELTGQIRRVEPRIVRRDGTPGNLAKVEFEADQGRAEYPTENLWIDLGEPGAEGLVSEVQDLMGKPVRVCKQTRPKPGHPEERGHGYLVWVRTAVGPARENLGNAS